MTFSDSLGGPAPLVSVVIPTRDRPWLLGRALLSALRQEDTDIEVIVVDDGSRQPVGEMLAEPTRTRVQVIHHERPYGVAAARNAGISAARGEWLAFLDDDDVWAPEKLRAELQVASRANADFAFISGLVLDGQGRVLRVEEAPADVSDLYRMTLAANPVPCGSSNVLVRTSLLRAVGGFDAEFSILADWDLTIRLSAAGRGATGPERLVAYRIHPGNMHRDEAAVAEELERFDRKHAGARAATGSSLDLEWWLSWRASTQRTAGERWLAAQSYGRLSRLRRSPGMAVRGLVLLAGGTWLLDTVRLLSRKGRSERDDQDPPSWLSSALDPPESALLEVFQADCLQFLHP